MAQQVFRTTKIQLKEVVWRADRVPCRSIQPPKEFSRIKTSWVNLKT